MKKSILFFAMLALALSAVPAFADNGDDVQDALNKAGFGVNENSKSPEGSTTVVRDPNAVGGSRYSDQSSSQENDSKDWSATLKYHTYMTGLDATYKFKTYGDYNPLPTTEAGKEYAFPQRFNHFQGQTVIGRPPSASDPVAKWPSEPWYDENGAPTPNHPDYEIYRYSGDRWGDCLGPRCIDRGEFRQPVGSWVHFTHTRIEERNDLQSNLGFPDTIQVLSNTLRQPVVELRNGRE